MNRKRSSRRLFDDLDLAYQSDKIRYQSNSYSGEYATFNQAQLIGHMMLTSHSLEKGLSNDKFELGHGYGKINQLATMINLYNIRGYDRRNPGYINALSILNVYLDIYKGSQHEKDIKAAMGGVELNFGEMTDSEKRYAGIKRVTINDKDHNDTKSFKELAEDRMSVRSFSQKPLDRKALSDAIRIAQKSPSACNRQSTRVYEIHDPGIISDIMTIQEGFGYKIPPKAILLIVADDSNYSGVGERNQGFIDGGMFAMSLMYALEYEKIAACPLHASFTYRKEQLFRQLLGIPDNEKLIVFLAIGRFRDDFTVAKSYRYPVDYITREITSLNKPTEKVPAFTDKYSMVDSIQKGINAMKRRIRIRTRIKNIQEARKEDKYFYSLYIKLHIMARSRNRIYIFGAPRHSNLGDQAQSLCIEEWCRKHYPNHKTIIIDTPSMFQRDSYIIRKIRSIIRENDKIILHSGYHTTDVWLFENNANIAIINQFPDRRIHVFPQTVYFENKKNLMDTAAAYNRHGNISLMCRDEVSYKIAKKHFKNVDVTLMPDIVTTLIGEKKFTNKNRDGINMCFRNDKESKYNKEIKKIKKGLGSITKNIEITDTTIDVDPYFIQNNRKRVVFNQIDSMSKKRLTITDRYHGTIFSIISNTPVIVLGSTDHKLSSGVKWFSDKTFPGLVYFARSPEEAVTIAKDIYGKYNYKNKIPQYFNDNYWDKLSLSDNFYHER